MTQPSNITDSEPASEDGALRHRFELELCVTDEEIEFDLCGHSYIPWSDFLLNPRRIRGSDFLMRWSQGEWSEKRLIQAVNDTGQYVAFAYGPSSVAPEGDVRAFELYFERLEAAGLGQLKRPDLLIFSKSDEIRVKERIDLLGGEQELPFLSEVEPGMRELLSWAIIAVECENSLWIAKQMPAYGRELTPQRRLGGLLGLPKNAVVPTVIIKDEDRLRLSNWQTEQLVPIHVWHAFFDVAYGIRFDDAESLILAGNIEPTVQTFQAPGGATTTKSIYKFYYHYAYSLGEAIEEAQLSSAHVIDKNGHILPYVKFEGGTLKLSAEALKILDQATAAKRT